MNIVKFFYHSPSSSLPIPDVRGEKNDKGSNKTEYHPLGHGLVAENWLKECQQQNIKRFASNGEYLFWITRCQNKTLPRYNQQLVVGYMQKKGWLQRPGKDKAHIAVYGEGHLYSFADSVPTKQLFGMSFDRPKLLTKPFVSEAQTQELLRHFQSKENILASCIEEIIAIDDQRKTCWPEVCLLSDYCVRASLPGLHTPLQP